MGIFNGQSTTSDVISSGERGPPGPQGPRSLQGAQDPQGPQGDAFKLDANNNYDIENKKLINVKPGTNNNDVVIKSQIQLLDSASSGLVVNDKAVIYSDSGSVHAQHLYLKDAPEDGLSNELRILTPHQSYNNIHLKIPHLKNFDGFGGRGSSEIMITSVDQTVIGKKAFQNIEVPNPTTNNQATNKYYVDHNFLNRSTGGPIGADIDMRGNSIKFLNLDTSNSAAARVNELNLKLSKSGGTMTGDIILQSQPYPVQGNTNKAISFSKKEGGPTENTLDMNNNFITNVKSHCL